MAKPLLMVFFLFLLSFTRSNPVCDHSRHEQAFLPEVRDISTYEEILPGLMQGQIKDTITWKTLNQLEYKEEQHEAYGTVMMPVFSKEVKALHNKRVIIKGYILPVDRKTYALSKNVYAACFFCGKAGPETVVGLTFKTPPGRIKMDTYATISGILRVNGSDVEDWMYSLSDVEILYMKE